MRRHVIPLLVLACAGGIGTAQQQPSSAPSGAQQPAVTFRTEVNFVEVHAIVTDAHGAFVTGLSKDDFEIYEDGKLQAPTVFSLVDLPIERPVLSPSATPPVESDVRATTRNFDGRIYILVLDDLHTSFTRSQLVRDAATRFVRDYFGRDDVAAVIYTSGRQDAAQELTGSRRLLLAAIDKFEGRKLPSAGPEKLALHLLEQMGDSLVDPGRSVENLQKAEEIKDPYDAERGLNAQRVLRLVKDIAGWMVDVHGRRKALLLFSEGIDYDIYDPFFNKGSAPAILADVRDAVGAAQRANLSVYAIDPRGLSQLSQEAIDVVGLSPYPQLDYGTMRGFLRELVMAQEGLISLADQTGGFALVNSNDVAKGLGQIVLDNSRYYMLGYAVDPTRRPGAFRKIEVRLKQPGLRVRARRGYVPVDPRAAAEAREAEVKAGTTPALKAALGLSLPVGDLPLRVFAAPFKGAGKNATVLVAVEIDGRALKFQERDGRFTQEIEISIAAVDYRAKVQGGDRQTFVLKLLPETRERVSRTGVRLLSRLDLPPARYQLRVGAREAVGGAVGTVPYDLEVPDYSDSSFALSGVVLTSSAAGTVATPTPDPLLKDVLRTPPVATRQFSREEALTVFAEVYDDSSSAAHSVNLVATVRSTSDGRTVFRARDNRGVEASKNGPRTQGFTTELPLRDLKPGSYVLRLEASSTATGRSVNREVPFEVGDGSI